MLNQGAYAPRSPNQVLPIMPAPFAQSTSYLSPPTQSRTLPVPMLDVNQGLRMAIGSGSRDFGAASHRVVCHAANVLYLLSYLVRDMLWSRLLTCVGLALGVIFSLSSRRRITAPRPGTPASSSSTAFIGRLVRERRRQMLTAKQEKVGGAAFQDLSREELLTLLSHVMCGPRRPARYSGDLQSTPQQRRKVLRDLGFSRLSRSETLNLLTRRMWNSIIRLKPAGWKRSIQPRSLASTLPPGRSRGWRLSLIGVLLLVILCGAYRQIFPFRGR